MSKSKLSINEINHAIMFGDLTNDQLNSVIQAVKYARGRLTQTTIWTMNLGDQVKFVNRHGRTEVGSVTKIAKKYVTVKVGFTQWRVPANMLEKAA
jgi:hypothetical protein